MQWTNPDNYDRAIYKDVKPCGNESPVPDRGLVSYGCTRPAGHEGVHVAQAGMCTVCQVWDDDRSTDVSVL